MKLNKFKIIAYKILVQVDKNPSNSSSDSVLKAFIIRFTSKFSGISKSDSVSDE